ncbi:hypothetical protein [Streptomyces sp. NPDC055400]
MAEHEQPEGPRQRFGNLAPALTRYSEEMLFEQAWEDPDLSPRGWNPITGGRSEQLAFRVGKNRENRLSDKELITTPPHGVLRRMPHGHVRAHRRPQCPERRLIRPPSTPGTTSTRGLAAPPAPPDLLRAPGTIQRPALLLSR